MLDAEDHEEVGGRKLALLIEYDGTRYSGFQIQDNALTVQEVLERALNNITGEGNRLKGASRTDTGVHALGQVATFVTSSRHAPRTFVAALNAHLPGDVAVRDATGTAPGFDPRREAESRWYRYVIVQRASPAPLLRKVSHRVGRYLDVKAMAAAAQELVGYHDCASFSAKLSNQTTTMREITRAGVQGAGEVLYFDIEANAFLPQQVRRTVGELIAIGSGHQPVERIGQLLESPVLGTADSPAPPQGLYLMGITYRPGAVRFENEGSTDQSGPWTAGIHNLGHD
ncbi:MAG: tRNA pseudouridine(38-40) synthase TruA [Chloroflexota bacterium]